MIEAIKSLGSWAHVHKSFWFVKSAFSATQARDRLLKAIDASDTIYVVDATNDDAAWFNLDPKVSDFIRGNWRKKAA